MRARGRDDGEREIDRVHKDPKAGQARPRVGLVEEIVAAAFPDHRRAVEEFERPLVN